MDMVFSSFAVLLFAAVILAIEGAWLWWSSTHGGGARRISKRLHLMAGRDGGGGAQQSILKQRRYSQWPALDQALRRLPQAALIERLLLQSGARRTVAQFLAASAAALIPGLLLPLFWQMPAVPSLAVLAGALLLPYGWLLRRRAARLRKLEAQLPETPISSAARCGPATPSPTCCKWWARKCPIRSPPNSNSPTRKSTTACR